MFACCYDLFRHSEGKGVRLESSSQAISLISCFALHLNVSCGMRERAEHVQILEIGARNYVACRQQESPQWAIAAG